MFCLAVSRVARTSTPDRKVSAEKLHDGYMSLPTSAEYLELGFYYIALTV
jgi:hypothetical protein